MTENSPFGPASLDVQPQALVDFSNAVKDHASTATETMGASMTDIGSAKLGGAPVASGSSFLYRYARGNLELNAFLTDLGGASSSFMMGALTIAANYIISDDAAKDEMSDVSAAFSTAGVPADRTLAGAQAAHDAQVEKKINGIKPVPLPEPTKTTPNVCTAAPPDSDREKAVADSNAIRNTDSTSYQTGDATDLSDVRASIHAPLSVQMEMANTTPDDPWIEVVGDDGNIKYIDNPTYEPPTYTYEYQGM